LVWGLRYGGFPKLGYPNNHVFGTLVAATCLQTIGGGSIAWEEADG